MAFSEAYRRQVDLLLRVIPFITKETCFALKGGTAINLFVRDLPRLSVDIDLTYIPVFPRPKSLGAIDKAMKRIAARIAKGNKATRTSSSIHEGAVTKLVVREHDVQIIIEVTPVLRGCAYEPEMRSVTARGKVRIQRHEVKWYRAHGRSCCQHLSFFVGNNTKSICEAFSRLLPTKSRVVLMGSTDYPSGADAMPTVLVSGFADLRNRL